MTVLDEGASTSLPTPDPTERLLPGSIETHLVTDVPHCSPAVTAGELRTRLSTRRYRSVADVAVCAATGNGFRLLGLIPVEALMAAGDDVRASSLMDPDPPVVGPGLDQEIAAWKAVQHGESSLAVVDDAGLFRGLVPPARLLAVLLTEHDEDLARLGGYLSSSASARHALDESAPRRLWHRFPWLLLGLLGAAVAALVVERFEGSVQADIRLAFFIPGIVYMADAVGTQTETLVIRGLSVNVPLRRVFFSEAMTGLTIGLILAAASTAATWWVLGSWNIALALGLSLLAACAVATVVAMALPWVFARFGRDPAFGSGPLATVIQDLLTLIIYFGIVGAIV